MKAVLLAGGRGSRLWPYAEIRNKAMAPIANRPIVDWTANAALAAGIDEVIVAAGPHIEQIRHHFSGSRRVRVVDAGATKGAAFTLAAAKAYADGSFVVLNGDTLYTPEDIAALTETVGEGPAVLLAGVPGGGHADYICAEAAEGRLTRVEGHPMNPMPFRICGYGFTPDCWPAIEACSTLMQDIAVGMMQPEEGYLEAVMADLMRAGRHVTAVEAASACVDVDKPWQLMQANAHMAATLCGAIRETTAGEGTRIDPTAMIEGKLHLGRNCTIGRNVLIRGNVITGDDTEIVDGAMILGDCVIGSGCSIRQYCQVESGSVLGDRCVVGHGAEFAGVAFETVYLYHYMEFWGVLGRNTDLGAATVCGTLRFDNGFTVQNVKGWLEQPREFANATYIGDFCRTGVNAILMPGVKTGVYSIVGPGVLLSEDLPNSKIIMLKQETTVRDWSPAKYGW